MAQLSQKLLVLDRLSSLSDEILVDILSLLPFNSAIITGTLSKRWRHLWTLITSVVIINRNVGSKHDLVTSVDQSIHRLTSPLIHTFIVDLQFKFTSTVVGEFPIDSWLSRICQRNLLHLDVSLRNHVGRFGEYQVQCPTYVFRTRSLVSIELRSTRIDYPCNDELIDLPNLKKLSMTVTHLQCDWLTKLTDSCPLLEDLSFDISSMFKAVDVKCLCPNLRRLSICLDGSNEPCKVMINAPKLEFLDASLYTNSILCIGNKPIIRLHEVKLRCAQRYFNRDRLSTDVEGCDLQLYRAISYVRSLDLSFDTVNTFTTFPNLTHLTLNFGSYCKFKMVMSFVEFCPVLEVLKLRFKDKPWFGEGEWPDILSTRTLERVKEIGIDVCYNTPELEEQFTKIIHYLLKRSSVLERFCFSVVAATSLKTTAGNAGSEHMLCHLLYNYPRASIDCEVSFTGQIWLMTRKDGSDVFTPIGDTVD